MKFIFCLVNVSAEAYDALDPNGNITIKWDVMSWTPDGYVVSKKLIELQNCLTAIVTCLSIHLPLPVNKFCLNLDHL